MKWGILGSVALLVTSAVVIALSVAEGGANVAIFGIIPVISGSSALFFLGVVLLFVGFLSVPFALATEWEEEPAPARPGPAPPLPANTEASPPSRGGFGGVVLIGPFPILFGSWKGISRQARWALALAGALLLTAFVVAVLWLLR